MAQKHNEQYVNAPMTRLGTIGWPDQDRRVIRSSAFVASKWTAENPILQLGEVGYETDTNKLKVGDGVTKWNSLPYAGDGAGSSLPDQTGHSGEFLTTDGTDASWGAVSEVPSTTGASEGDVLTVDSNGDPAWTTPSGGGLPDQTGQSGKFLTTDGTDASWATISALQNTATATDSLTILGTANTTRNKSINMGVGSVCSQTNAVCIGYNAQTGSSATSIGCEAKATAASSVSIGYKATAGAFYSIQIGGGDSGYTNSNRDTVKFGNSNGNFEIMSADGTIPAARHASLPATDGTYVLKLVMASGVPTLSWVAE